MNKMHFGFRISLILACSSWLAGDKAGAMPPPTASLPAALSFGSNQYGQTGLNSISGDTLIATPIHTTNLAGKSITQVSAGGRHSIALADDGTVFSFGRNISGQTGLNTTSGETLIATPIDTTNLAGKRITQIAAGELHSLLLADDGTVFSFGMNFSGQGGLNRYGSLTLVATPIDTTNLAGPHARVTGISAGGHHSLVLAVPEPTSASVLFLTSLPLLLLWRSRRSSVA